MSHAWTKEFWRGLPFIASSNDPASPNVLLGAPMDFSASFRPGSRFGPESIRQVSYNLEEYSLFVGKSLEDLSFYDAGDLQLPFGNVSRSLHLIEEAIRGCLERGQRTFTIGGDHLISWPCLKAYSQHFPQLTVVHIDAHADLRDDYMGEERSHATVIGNALRELPLKDVYQFAIRSATQREHDTAKRTRFFPFTFVEPLRTVLGEISGPVYITLDIDAVDPAYAPGVGTPESGGITPHDLFEGLKLLSAKNVVGFDLVEVAPAYDNAGITSALAAKLVRESLLMFGRQP